MKCERCQGHGTIVLQPAAVPDGGADRRGAVIALCPACQGAGVAKSERRGTVHAAPPPALRPTGTL